MATLKIHRLYETAPLPKYATEESACFDIFSFFKPDGKIIIYDPVNEKDTFPIKSETIEYGFPLAPSWRALIPTGLVLDIPKGYSVRIHPRSGNAIKTGIFLVNCTGIIDSDYVEEVMVPVINSSNEYVIIKDLMRIAQGELVKCEEVEIVDSPILPDKKTDRNGGFGSTGIH